MEVVESQAPEVRVTKREKNSQRYYAFPVIDPYFEAWGVGTARTLAISEVATTAKGTKLERYIVVMLSFLAKHLNNKVMGIDKG